MPRSANKTGRSLIKGRFAMIPAIVMQSVAYSSASLPARALLMELALLYHGGNNGALGLSARQAAERLRCSKNTATRAFRELEGRGLADRTFRGSFKAKVVTHASEWRLAWHKCDRTGNLPSHAYRHWKEVKPAQEAKPTQERNSAGRCGGQHGATTGTVRQFEAANGAMVGTVAPVTEPARSDERDTLRIYHRGRGE